MLSSLNLDISKTENFPHEEAAAAATLGGLCTRWRSSKFGNFLACKEIVFMSFVVEFCAFIAVVSVLDSLR